MPTASQFMRYALVGVVNAIVDFSILNALSITLAVYSGALIIVIKSIAAGAVIIQSYLLNKYWTFRAFESRGPREFVKFALVNAGAFAINTAIVYVMTTFLGPPEGVGPLLWENMANALAIGVAVAWNFLGFKFLVFGARREQHGP